MLPRPVCLACGIPIGHLAELVRAEKARQLAAKLEETGTAPELARLDPECSPDLGEFLDKLRVHCEYCRVSLMCAVDIRDTP
jgi:hypothetical protein